MRYITTFSVTATGGVVFIFALCNDGTFWKKEGAAEWVEVEAIPQPVTG